MNRTALPLNALRAFETAARHGNLKAAAAELHVTHSAVSQHVRHLEEIVGVKLFHRTNRGVRMTAAAERLFPILNEMFDRVTDALQDVAGANGDTVLRVTTTPLFSTKWLLPRLDAWRKDHQDLSVHLVPTFEFLDPVKGEAEICIRCGTPPWPGLTSEFLLPIHLTPVCGPTFLGGGRVLAAPSEVLDFTLIHADITGHPMGEEWTTWLASAGVADGPDLQGLSFRDPNLALQAAIDGHGIAMGYLELIEQDVAAGRLIQPFDLCARHGLSYHLAYPAALKTSPGVVAFREWVTEQAQS